MATLKNIGLLFLLPIAKTLDIFEGYGAFITLAFGLVGAMCSVFGAFAIGLEVVDYEAVRLVLDWSARSSIATCFSFSLWVGTTFPNYTIADRVWLGTTAMCGALIGSMGLYFYLV
ncbi:hypothetical protein CMI37_37610 [Candidatus Pacearchaeota archaeon]|nr:hypothetical protein [Candidatus Pacearchaeota archaeon]